MGLGKGILRTILLQLSGTAQPCEMLFWAVSADAHKCLV